MLMLYGGVGFVFLCLFLAKQVPLMLFCVVHKRAFYLGIATQFRNRFC